MHSGIPCLGGAGDQVFSPLATAASKNAAAWAVIVAQVDQVLEMAGAHDELAHVDRLRRVHLR